MPAFVTHELLGTQVFSMLDEPIAEMLELNPSPYFWGLQGPDLLFFRDAVFGRSMLPKYGNIMHTQKTDELFAAMSCYLNLHKGENSMKRWQLISWDLQGITAWTVRLTLMSILSRSKRNGCWMMISNAVSICGLKAILIQLFMR